MPLLLGLLWPIERWNDVVLRIGRWISVGLIAAMVIVTLVQVFFRYVLNNALPWPDEAARFFMLWLTGLMAPTAFRQGGFVAIDMAVTAMPARIGAIVSILLLVISALVLAVAIPIGWAEITGFGGRFATASLYLPTSITFDTWFRIPKSWMLASLFVGVLLLFIVNIELILRGLIAFLGGEDRLRPITTPGNEIMTE